MCRTEYRPTTDAEAQRANRVDRDAEADDYQREHGEFLRDVGFVWSPEGLDEAVARLLGEVADARVLEIGCGAAQCARWLRSQGAEVVGLDLSLRQLQHSRRIDDETSIGVPTVCATATALPCADACFDIVCSAFGALPFVVDIDQALREVGRVLRPGGRFACSVLHPVRRMFPDDPSERGLTVTRSYFDRRAYVELGADGLPGYVEPHHTLGDWIVAIVSARLVIERIVEPEWPPEHTRVWGAGVRSVARRSQAPRSSCAGRQPPASRALPPSGHPPRTDPATLPPDLAANRVSSRSASTPLDASPSALRSLQGGSLRRVIPISGCDR